jgi:hypothetical protein
MRVELSPPESVTEPRLWVRHDQAFTVIEWNASFPPRKRLLVTRGVLAR